MPTVSPENVHGHYVDSRALKVEWNPPADAMSSHAIITYYKVNYTKANDEDKVREATIGANEKSFVIRNLEEWTDYRVSVSACNTLNCSVWSDPVIIRTDEAGTFLCLCLFLFISHYLS